MAQYWKRMPELCVVKHEMEEHVKSMFEFVMWKEYKGIVYSNNITKYRNSITIKWYCNPIKYFNTSFIKVEVLHYLLC